MFHMRHTALFLFHDIKVIQLKSHTNEMSCRDMPSYGLFYLCINGMQFYCFTFVKTSYNSITLPLHTRHTVYGTYYKNIIVFTLNTHYIPLLFTLYRLGIQFYGLTLLYMLTVFTLKYMLQSFIVLPLRIRHKTFTYFTLIFTLSLLVLP